MRRSPEFGEKERIKCTSLLLAIKRDRETQSDLRVWCCLCCVHYEPAAGFWAVFWVCLGQCERVRRVWRETGGPLYYFCCH